MPVIVSGATESADALRTFANQVVTKDASETLDEAAKLLISKARPRARVDTGFMRDNIEVTEKTVDSITVTSQAEYSIYNEEGTSRMSAQPFMAPSAAEVEQEAVALFRKKITASISYAFKTKVK